MAIRAIVAKQWELAETGKFASSKELRQADMNKNFPDDPRLNFFCDFTDDDEEDAA